MQFQAIKQLLIKWIGSILFSLIICSTANAQSKSYTDVKRFQHKNLGTIMEGDQVKGYFLFYLSNKQKGATQNYKLEILDTKLNTIASKTITGNKHLTLKSAAQNNEDIMIKLYDGKEKIISMYQYTVKGELKNQEKFKPRSLPVKESTVYPIEKNGFVDYYSLYYKKRQGYGIRFYPSTEDGLPWTYKSSSTADTFEEATLLTVNDRILLSTITKRKNLTSKDGEQFILGLDIISGEKLFEKPLEDSKYALQVINGFKNEENGNLEITGHYYDKSAKTDKAASKGIFFFTLEESSNTFSRKYVSWSEDVNKFISSNAKGKLNKTGYVYFHKIIRNNNGKIYAIGEQYQKVADGNSVLGTVLSGQPSSNAMSMLVIDDFYVFEFDQDFNLLDVEVIEKIHTQVPFEAGASFMTPQAMAQDLKNQSGFDYLFTQNEKDQSSFTIGYLINSRKGAYKTKIYGAGTFDENEFTIKEIDLKTSKSATSIQVSQAKQAFILISQYLPNYKRLDFRFAKVSE